MGALEDFFKWFDLKVRSKHFLGKKNQSGRKNKPGQGKKYRKRNILCTGWIRGSHF